MVHERRSCLSFLPVDVVEKVESNQALCLCQKIVLDEHANDTASFELVRLGETRVECLRNLLEGLVWLLQDRQQTVQLLLRHVLCKLQGKQSIEDRTRSSMLCFP